MADVHKAAVAMCAADDEMRRQRLAIPGMSWRTEVRSMPSSLAKRESSYPTTDWFYGTRTSARIMMSNSPIAA